MMLLSNGHGSMGCRFIGRANREMVIGSRRGVVIEIFEAKIKAKLAEIWGEEESAKA
jgi:hypothetical protein